MSKNKLYKSNLPKSFDIVKEAAVSYGHQKQESSIPNNWEVFKNVISENSKSEIANYLSSAKNVGINKNTYAELLNVNLRTLNRYLSSESPLDYDKKEKAIRLNNLFIHGIEVFENVELFSSWLFEKNSYLNNSPISFLSVISGIEIIDNLLGKIDYGIIG